MRVAITSRIFEPEPSAASFRLGSLARRFAQAGHDVTVLTVRPPERLATLAADDRRPYRVRRARVLRDSSGYVRGYLQYMSFDIPLFFRLLFGRSYDLIVAEPPPTTGFFVRIAATLRRTPYAYYAADIWSDAASQTGAPGWIVRLVRGIERFALRGASAVLSVSDGVTGRLAELGISGNVVTIGNGIDTHAFRIDASAAATAASHTAVTGSAPGSAPDSAPDSAAANATTLSTSTNTPVPHGTNKEFVYAGTASEWHGAVVFVEALPAVLERHPTATLRFIGGGSEREALDARALELGVAHAIRFEELLPPEQLAPILRDSVAAIASVRPGAGYDFAFPTKLYSAAACGAPLIYSGIGPAVDFVNTEVGGAPLGTGTGADASEVASAMIAALDRSEALSEEDRATRRRVVSEWAAANVSLDAVAERALAAVLERLAERRGRR